MSTKVHGRDGDSQWTANVSGSSVTLDGATDTIDVRDQTDGRWSLTRGDRTYDACAAVQGDVVWIAIDGELFDIRVDTSGGSRRETQSRDLLTAPMPATVVRIAAPSGTRVAKGDTLIVLEAMKMELPIRASHDGVVKAVHCREGELVQPGAVLVDLE